MSRNYFEVADRRYNMDIDICGLSQDFLGYLVKVIEILSSRGHNKDQKLR